MFTSGCVTVNKPFAFLKRIVSLNVLTVWRYYCFASSPFVAFILIYSYDSARVRLLVVWFVNRITQKLQQQEPILLSLVWIRIQGLILFFFF